MSDNGWIVRDNTTGTHQYCCICNILQQNHFEFVCYANAVTTLPKVTKVYLTLHGHPKFMLFIRLTFLSLTLHIETPTFEFAIWVISYKGLLQLYITNPTFKSTIFQGFRNNILKRIIFHLHYLFLSFLILLYHITHFHFITPSTLFIPHFFNLIFSCFLILSYLLTLSYPIVLSLSYHTFSILSYVFIITKIY